jgi:hypothetical protein
MQYLKSFNEGLFDNKKIDTTWINGIKSGLETFVGFSDITLNRFIDNNDRSILDGYKLSFKYEDVSMYFTFELKVDSDPYDMEIIKKIRTGINRLFQNPMIRMKFHPNREKTHWSNGLFRVWDRYTPQRDYLNFRPQDDYSITYILSIITESVQLYHNEKNTEEEKSKKTKELCDSFKDNLPEYLLRDLIINIEDIIGQYEIKFMEATRNGVKIPIYKISFTESDLFKVFDLSSYPNHGRKINSYKASNSLFNVMSELSELYHILNDKFNCKMHFTIENKLIIFIS